MLQINIKSIKVTENNKSRSTCSKMYVFTDTPNALLKNLLGDEVPWEMWKTSIVPHIVEKLQLEPTDISWSRKAGCSCGCSPGFILKGTNTPKRIFVHIDYTQMGDPSEDAVEVIDLTGSEVGE